MKLNLSDSVNKLTDILFLKPGIGVFPQLPDTIKHGFSWGKDSGNMAFTFGEFPTVRKNVQDFLDNARLGDIRQTVNINPLHQDKILFINQSASDNLRQKPKGRDLKSDAVFTNVKDLTLTVKPADCTTAIIYVPRPERDDLIGIVHSGRRSVSSLLPIKAVKYLEDKFQVDPSEIKIFITPHLFKENRKFENLDDVENLDEWENFIENIDDVYFLDETGLAIHQYLRAGVKAENVFEYSIDTYEAAKKGETFSHKLWYEESQKDSSLVEGRMILGVQIN